MALTDYEKACVRSWAMDHAQKRAGKKSVPVEALIDEAAKISGFIMGGADAEIVPIENSKHRGGGDEIWLSF